MELRYNTSGTMFLPLSTQPTKRTDDACDDTNKKMTNASRR
jgi:hypothetical protein